MADDLMDFSEFGGNENDENVDPEVELAPKLMQTPVVKHSILKQSTKDNLIQLFTPVNKSKKLKVSRIICFITFLCVQNSGLAHWYSLAIMS